MTDPEKPADDEQESQLRRQKVKGIVYVPQYLTLIALLISCAPRKDEFFNGE
jgi:hypothetical protein